MACTRNELIDWLMTLPIDADIAIDEGGLALEVVEDPDVRLEVGGNPDDDPMGDEQ